MTCETVLPPTRVYAEAYLLRLDVKPIAGDDLDRSRGLAV